MSENQPTTAPESKPKDTSLKDVAKFFFKNRTVTIAILGIIIGFSITFHKKLIFLYEHDEHHKTLENNLFKNKKTGFKKVAIDMNYLNDKIDNNGSDISLSEKDISTINRILETMSDEYAKNARLAGLHDRHIKILIDDKGKRDKEAKEGIFNTLGSYVGIK